jgi:hypothetical protein
VVLGVLGIILSVMTPRDAAAPRSIAG